MVSYFNIDDQGACSLSIRQTLYEPNCVAHQPLLLFETIYGNVFAYHFTEEKVVAFDDAGSLPIYFTNNKPLNSSDQEWRVTSNTSGNVVLQFMVFPRNVDITTPIGPRVDMRRDQGGLIAVGRWFLPRPAANRVRLNVVEWDLSDAPQETRAVWTYGEGPEPVTKEEKPMTVANSVFMVGPIQNFPKATCSPGLNTYWFGRLPGNIHALNQYNMSLFPKLAGFFQSKSASYCVFIRRVIRGYGGSACLESYVFEYDEKICKETEEELISLFTHEMIQSFSLMDVEDDGYDNGWYIEGKWVFAIYRLISKLTPYSSGLAEFYSISLPYRFGLCSLEYLFSRLNATLQAYGDSPRIHMDIA
jgi:hypothetical protein